MSSKSLRILLVVLFGLFLVAGSFTGGVLAGWSIVGKIGTAPVVSLFGGNATSTPVPGAPEDVQTLFKPFWQAWDLVNQQYVDQPVDQTTLMRGAIRGMLDSLGDPHTGYMDPTEFQRANTPLQGEYEGIGAWVDTTGDFLTIISPMPGSPAEAAGLQSGDKIIGVGGKDVTGKDPSLVLRDVLGPEGTTVNLTIQREGVEQPIEVSIIRKKIDVPTLDAKMLDNNIAYVQILDFGDKTDTELHTKLRDLLKNKPVGLILDLRNNPGGYLDTALKVVSEFIDNGVIMYEQNSSGEKTAFDARPGGVATSIPLVVLINGGSASASEITAGAVQDRGRGVLVGTTSYGKGTVQTWTPLVDDQGAVKVTIAKWLTPNERQITGIGLTPDVEVKITEADVTANVDPQLNKAVELLLNLQEYQVILSK